MIRKIRARPAAIYAVIFAIVSLLAAACTQTPTHRFEAVSSEIPVGPDVRIELRLLDAKGAAVPAARIRIGATRLDMGPDGMAAMDTPLVPESSSDPNVLAFTTKIIEAGRWALMIEATVEGVAQPIKGEIIFTAVEKKAEAGPAASAAGERRALFYRNPMGLADTSPVPKKDSMGMDYIAVYADEVSAPKGMFRVSLDKVQRAGVRSEPAARRALMRSVRGAGSVTVDEAKIAVVNAKFDGFVERLIVRTTGERVEQGAPLLSIWIEGGTNTGQDVDALLRKQADYIAALNRGGPDIAITAGNLRAAGVANSTLAQIAKTRKAVRTMQVIAPIAGTVIEKPALDGMRFSSGDVLFKLADLSRVWVIAEIPEQDLSLIRKGQTARLSFPSMPGEDVQGGVEYIYPMIDGATRSGKARIALENNSGRLKLGLFVHVSIDAPASDAAVLAIPRSAVIDDGTRRVALIERGQGLYAVRDLKLGSSGGDYVEVREGLKENDRVVVAGTFLMDAESNLQAALQAFTADGAKR
jgi:Cu(I)/Ag(I) efflux system membrane fusion protein